MKKLPALLAIVGVVSILNFAINPNRPIYGLQDDEVTLGMAVSIMPSAIILDARAPEDFAKGHVGGAINLSEEKFDEQVPAFLEAWNPAQKVIVYCSSSACNSSRNIADRLKNEFEIRNVFVLKGDWTQWKK